MSTGPVTHRTSPGSKLVLIVLLSLACETQTVGPAPPGAFEYRAYDSLGTAILEGWLLLVPDTIRTTGEWHFRRIGDPHNIGPQTGDGVLAGQLQQGQLSLDLNPHVRDNNVLLSGAFDGESYQGSWMYVGFPGIINRGTFLAIKRIR